ncbi:MAG: EAL domain-containing protein [Lachnospiraceae bacterium]|nr:EAL domain-containing protein [Lachnospiraceae bacterium]
MSLCFDITALCVSLIMLFTYYLRRNIFMKSGYYYSFYLVLLILLSISDIILDLDEVGIYKIDSLWWYTVKVIGMFVTYFLTYIVLRYFMAVMSYRKFGRGMSIIVVVYVIIITSIMVSTPFTGWVLSVKNGVITRGGLYLLPYYVGLFTFAIIFIAAFQFREKLSRSTRAVIVISVLILLFAAGWQIVWADKLGIKLFTYAYMVVGMLLYTTLQDPYLYYYKYNLCFNERCFLDSVDNKLSEGKKFSVFFLGIDNMGLVVEALPETKKEELENRIISMLHEVCKKKNVFIIDDLSFAIITTQDVREVMVRVSNQVDKICFDLDMKKSLSPIIYAFKHDAFYSFDHIYKALSYVKDKKDRENESDTIVFLNTSRFDFYDRELKVYSALLRAIKNESFSVYFQPIFNSDNSDFVSAEVLLRIEDKELGLIYPSEFIPIAEKNGLMGKLGELVFDRVCHIASKYNLHSLGMDFIDINISYMQCIQSDMADRLIAICGKYHLTPGFINLEITDKAFQVDDNSTMIMNIKKLMDYGMTFTIDNFGTAAANAEKIIRFPVRYVKFDKSAIWNALLSDKCKIVTGNMVRMIRDLNIKAVACGIETDNLLGIIRDMDFSYYQGYYFSKPIPEDEFVYFLTSRLS